MAGLFLFTLVFIIAQFFEKSDYDRIKEVDLKYFALVKNPLLIEKCIGFKLDNQRYMPGR